MSIKPVSSMSSKEVSRLLIRTTDKSLITYRSYGDICGNFYTKNIHDIYYVCIDKTLSENTAFLEIKTPVSKLAWDFDFKDKNKHLYSFTPARTAEVVKYFIDKIITALQIIFKDPDIRYVYGSCKSIRSASEWDESGVHLYFPFITVTKEIHQLIYNIVFQEIKKERLYSLETVNAIFDKCVISNNLRLFYTTINNRFYYPNEELSTVSFIGLSEIDKFMFSSVSTLDTACNHELLLKPTDILTDSMSLTLADNKPKYINITKSAVEYENDSPGEPKLLEMSARDCCVVSELIDFIPTKILDNYETWIKFIYLCYNCNISIKRCSELSAKSTKYDEDSIKKIKKIYKKGNTKNEQVSVGTLIHWVVNFNNKTTLDTIYKILRKFNVNVKLNIEKTDELFLNLNNAPHYTTETKYIADDLIDKFIESKKKCLVIHSATGTGKTTVINDFFDKIESHLKRKYLTSVVSIVSRRTMAVQHKNSFSKIGLTSYLDDKKDINENFYVVSLENIATLSIKCVDVLVLDEINSLIQHFYSSTMENYRLKSLEKLNDLVRNATYVICMDANITDIVFQFIIQSKLENDMYYYRNLYQNKKGICMNIYTPKHCSEDNAIMMFATNITPYIKKRESVLILSDSKAVTVKLGGLFSDSLKKIKKKDDSDIEEVEEVEEDDDYVQIINSKQGTLEDISKCDITFKNKCVIASPRIIYGLDITVPYDKVFCIYKRMNVRSGMTCTEYYQQFSRARNCKGIEMLVLNYNNVHPNYYVPKEYHTKLELDDFEKYLSNIIDDKNSDDDDTDNTERTTSIRDKFKLLQDLTTSDKQNKFFYPIHMTKTWFDRLLSQDKLSIIKMLGAEAGYTVADKELEIKTIFSDDLKKYIEGEKNTTEKIARSIYNGTTIKDLIKKYRIDIDETASKKEYNAFKKYYDNLKEKIDKRRVYLESCFLEDIASGDIDKGTKLREDIIVDDIKFDSFMNKRLLELSLGEFNKQKTSKMILGLKLIEKNNNIIKNIDTLFTLEEIFRMERFQVNEIRKFSNRKIKKIKEKLTDFIGELCILFDNGNGIKKVKAMVEKMISNIKSNEEIKKFIYRAYNCLGDIMSAERHEKKVKQDDGKYKSILTYTYTLIN